LSVYADLAQRADLSATDRAVTASRLIAAVEAVTPHVTDASVIPYEEVLKATASLDCGLGLATASRWDDEDRIALAQALPAALEGAVTTGALPGGQALALDHLIDNNARRLAFQITVTRHLASAGPASSRADTRTALVRAATWLRLRVPVRSQPRLASRLVDAARSLDQAAAVQPMLEPVIALTPPGRADESQGGSATWIGDTEDSPGTGAPAASVSAASWRTLASDVEATGTAALYSRSLVQHLTRVIEAAPMTERLSALDAAASLASTNAPAVIEALAGLVEQWRHWPGVETWAKTTATALLAEHLPDLVRTYDPPRLARQLLSLGDDATIRSAILRALPSAQTRLTAFGWQTVAVVLGRLCEPAAAADALTGLLAPYPATTPTHPEPDESPLPVLLWSAFGHPRREIRWRAAHAARELLIHQDHATVRPLAAALVA
ncbi:hypothetical protein ACWEBX_40895, partial [Streptomyces sp. NPDC005070]